MMKTPPVYTLALLIVLVSCEKKEAPVWEQQQDSSAGISESRIVDLSHSYSDKTVYWVTAKEFELDTVFKGQTEKGYYYAANNFSTAEHGGTHLDAPIHFAQKGQTVDQVPLEKLIGKAIKIDVSAKALKNRDYLISIDDLKAWETKQGQAISEGSIVLLQTGYSKFYPDKEKYLGTMERGEQAIRELHFPGLAPEAAQWLVEHRRINAIGIDTPSIDFGQSELFQSHVILLSENIPVFENLNHLEKLPDTGFDIIALPMKIEGGSGAPLRIVAMIR